MRTLARWTIGSLFSLISGRSTVRSCPDHQSGRDFVALTSENVSCCASPRTLLLARSNPLATADRRTLVHAECTERPSRPAIWMQTTGAVLMAV
jgi:hypothetical protein